MHNIEFEITPIEEAGDAILESIKKYFLKDLDNDFIALQIEADIGNYLDGLKEGLYCLIEYPYVDKVYRDSYYNYYSSKHYTYPRDCIRVSLFASKIKPEDFLNSAEHKKLNEIYLGYFIIRPTANALFGRSIIAPIAFEKNDFKICQCKINNLVYGVKLETEGFPHSSQDGETIKCAETTICVLMEYFGNKYPEYRTALPSAINKSLDRIAYQRLLPSNGLTMNQISFALKEFGFGTRIYSSAQYNTAINHIIDCYVESGIPVLIGLESENTGHVIIAIGKKYSEKIVWNKIPKSTYSKERKEVSYFDTTNFPAKYVIQDDNLRPYGLIGLNKPGEHYADDDSQGYRIDSIIVPLYPKIYLEAVVAKELVIQIIKDNKLGYRFSDNFVFRFFLASGRSFKNHVSQSKDMANGLKHNILASKMPKFIWCGEFYAKDTYQNADKEAIGLVVLDATEANQSSIYALIFAGYPDRCVSMVENNFATLQYRFEKYHYYSNLT